MSSGCGGGGGAGGTGSNATPSVSPSPGSNAYGGQCFPATSGGSGAPNDITGSNVTYDAGGVGRNYVTQGFTSDKDAGANTGDGAGGTAANSPGGGGNGAGSGGSGIMVIKETTPKCASGVWSINDHFDQVKNSEWIARTMSVDYLVVAGGGGGGNSFYHASDNQIRHAGGGGAGGDRGAGDGPSPLQGSALSGR